MSTPTANPTGADESGVLKAADEISQLLNPEAPEAQPEPEAAPAEEANQPVYDEATGRYRDPVTNQFVKGPEPEAEEGAEPSEAPTEEGADAADPEEPGEEYEELADTLEGLAEQLGMEVSDLSSTLKATVKINGEEQQVTLSELATGYQMEGDYRRKTAEVAEQRRSLEDAQTAVEKQREQFSSQLEPMLDELNQLVTVDEQWLNQLASEGRWEEHAQYRYAADMRKAELTKAQEAKQTLEQENREQAIEKHNRAVEAQEELLKSLKPDWAKDTEKGKKEISTIRQYLKSEDFDPRFVDGLFDSRLIVMAEKAMRYDALQKAKPDALNKVRAVPKKVMRPGPAKRAEDPKKKVHRTNLNRLRQTGSVRDATPVFKEILGLE